MEKWKPIYLERETNNSKFVKHNISIKLCYKFTNKTVYITLNINALGEFQVKLTDFYLNYYLSKKEIYSIFEIVNETIKKCNKYSKSKLTLIDLENNLNVEPISMNCMTELTFDPNKLNFEQIKEQISKYIFYGYYVNNDDNNFSIKYKCVDNVLTDENIKKYFFTLKKSLGSVSIQKLRDTFIQECKIKFGLSQIQTLQILQMISEDVEEESITQKSIKNIINIVVSKTNEINTLNISIINATDFKKVNEVLNYVNKILNSSNIKQQKNNSNKSNTNNKHKVVLPKLIELKEDVIKQTFVNDDEIDMDIEYSDSEVSDSRSDNESQNEEKKSLKIKNRVKLP